MLFNSYPFLLLFLPITLVVFFRLGRFSRRLAATWLSAASLAFYAFWNPAYLLLLILSIFFNYSVGVGLTRFHDRGATRQTRSLLLFGVAVNLAVLGYYKYAGFFIQNLNQLLDSGISLEGIILPLGISFFTFTQIAFLVDASRGLARELNFIHYGLFVTYYPHLIAGPVLHHKEMMPQFAQPATYRVNLENFAVGSAVFGIGLFKKTVLADGIAPYVGPGFHSAAGGALLTFLDAWGCALAYTFQLYFDFSGYTDMAIGLSRLIGVRLPLNFNSPYRAESIIEFWRRWHMTLSRFLRDYLYIPLGGNRRGPLRRHLNLLITMFLGGLWHGAGWTFIFWGSLHGFYLIINHAWLNLTGWLSTRTGRNIALGRWIGTLITFLAVVVGWVFFRAPDFGAALTIIKGMVGMHGLAVPVAYLQALPAGVADWLRDLGIGTMLGGGSRLVSTYLWILGLAAVTFLAPNTQTLLPMIEPDYRGPVPTLGRLTAWAPTTAWAVALGLVTALGILGMNQVSEFLYFQF